MLLQAGEILSGVKKSVYVIDPQTCDASIFEEFKQKLVDSVENDRIFDTYRGQIIHIKETPIVDLFGRDSPVTQPVSLRIEEFVQFVKRMRIANASFQMFNGKLDRIFNLRAFSAESRDPPFNYLLFSRAFPDFFFFDFVTVGKIFCRGQNTLQIKVHILIGVLAQLLECDPKNEFVGSRIEREHPVIVSKPKSAFLELQMKLAAFKYAAVLISENWEKHFILKLFLQRVPINVKERGKPRAWAILEDIHPPLILGIDDAHMIRYKIGHLAERELLQLGDHRIELFTASYRGIQFVVIADVVAMMTVRTRTKKRRAINVADPEPLQIWDDFCCVFESKMPVVLQPVGRSWYAQSRCHLLFLQSLFEENDQFWLFQNELFFLRIKIPGALASVDLLIRRLTASPGSPRLGL